VIDHLELYLDGLDGTDGADEGLPSLSGDDKAVVEQHLTRCPSCAQELNRAQRIRDGLRALPDVPYELPGAEPTASEKLFPGTWARPAMRWAVPLAAAAVVAVAVWMALPRNPGADPGTSPGTVTAAHTVSDEELARAELEARYALARLAEATRRARREIREDVLARHVVAPVQRELLRSFSTPQIPEDAQQPPQPPQPPSL